jgi:hypothetical protein
MWIAHFAVGLAAKAIAPSADLGWLMFYGALPDFLVFSLNYWLGIESFNLNKRLEARGEGVPIDWSVDYSHSLIGTLLLMLFCALLVATRTKSAEQRSRMAIANRPVWDNEAIAASLLIFSHFLMELPVHRKDIRMSLSIFPRPMDSYWGAGLFKYTTLSFVIELAILLASGYIYLRTTKEKRGTPNCIPISNSDVSLFLGVLLLEHIRFYYTTFLLHLPLPLLSVIFSGTVLGLCYYGHYIDQGRESTIKPGIMRFDARAFRISS